MDFRPRVRNVLTAACYGCVAFFFLVMLASMYVRVCGLWPERVLNGTFETVRLMRYAMGVSCGAAACLWFLLHPEHLPRGGLQELARLAHTEVCRMFPDREQRGFPVIGPGDDDGSRRSS